MKLPPDLPFATILDALPVAVALASVPDARIRYSNRAFDSLLGSPPGGFSTAGQWMARACIDGRQRALLRRHWDVSLSCRDGAEVSVVPDIEIDVLGGDGRMRTMLHYGVVLHGRKLAVVICKDITRLKHDNLLLKEYAFLDPLTGIPNRRGFDEYWRDATTAGHFRRLAFLMLDLDGFKSINDTFGHPVGDAVLCSVASRLKDVVRESDFVCRLGGDEFGLLLNVPEGGRQMEDICQRITCLVGEQMVAAGVQVRVTASVGACLYPDQASDKRELLQRADRALYRIKASGKGRCGWWAPESGDGVEADPAIAGPLLP